MELNNFETFRSGDLEKTLQVLPSKYRNWFVKEAYRLATLRFEKHIISAGVKQAYQDSRQSRECFGRIAAHLKNALREINEAIAAAPSDWPKLPKWLEIDKAADSVDAAYQDIGFLMGIDIATIPPKRRTRFEEQHRTVYGSHGLLVSMEANTMSKDVRSSTLDYAFCHALYRQLDRCSGKSIPPIVRYGIISQVFLDAFGLEYPPATVKKACQRAASRKLSMSL